MFLTCLYTVCNNYILNSNLFLWNFKKSFKICFNNVLNSLKHHSKQSTPVNKAKVNR